VSRQQLLAHDLASGPGLLTSADLCSTTILVMTDSRSARAMLQSFGRRRCQAPLRLVRRRRVARVA
jgi:hypothetical protein